VSIMLYLKTLTLTSCWDIQLLGWYVIPSPELCMPCWYLLFR
jgi:hypothetical protein